MTMSLNRDDLLGSSNYLPRMFLEFKDTTSSLQFKDLMFQVFSNEVVLKKCATSDVEGTRVNRWTTETTNI